MEMKWKWIPAPLLIRHALYDGENARQPLSMSALRQNKLYGVVDLNVDPRWEINFGVGGGLARATDGLIIKMILGRRF